MIPRHLCIRYEMITSCDPFFLNQTSGPGGLVAAFAAPLVTPPTAPWDTRKVELRARLQELYQGVRNLTTARGYNRLALIFNPDDSTLDAEAADLLWNLWQQDADDRITLEKALAHRWFHGEASRGLVGSISDENFSALARLCCEERDRSQKVAAAAVGATGAAGGAAAGPP